MAWANIADKSGGDVALASDFNQLMENARVLGGNGTSAPSTDIETLNSDVDALKTLPTKTVTSATYTVTNADIQDYGVIEFDTTSNNIVVTLPDRVTNAGYQIKLKHSIQGSTNLLTINRAGADTITQDLFTSILLPKVGNFIDVFASTITGNWEILEEFISSQLRLDTYAGYGSADTNIMQFTNSNLDIGNMFTHNHGSYGTAGLEITASRSGHFSGEYTSQSGSGADAYGLSLNSTQLSTNILNITQADKLDVGRHSGTYSTKTAFKGWFDKGDIIRPHAEGPAPATANYCFFNIMYMGQ